MHRTEVKAIASFENRNTVYINHKNFSVTQIDLYLTKQKN